MKITPQYLTELKVLHENYRGRDLERALGISIRQVQNYLKEDKPAKPSPEVVNKIHEVFAKHQNKEPLIISEPEQEYKSKYVAILERENTRLQRDLELSLGSLRHTALLALAVAETNQQLLIELVMKLRKKDFEEIALEVGKENGERYTRLKEERKIVYEGN